MNNSESPISREPEPEDRLLFPVDLDLGFPQGFTSEQMTPAERATAIADAQLSVEGRLARLRLHDIFRFRN